MAPLPLNNNTLRLSLTSFITLYSVLAVTFPKRDAEPVPRVGWVSSPLQRSTLDILSACGTTLFICSWQSLLIHVPGQQDSNWRIIARKLLLVGLCFLAPELLVGTAINQRLSADKSVRKFEALARERSRKGSGSEEEESKAVKKTNKCMSRFFGRARQVPLVHGLLDLIDGQEKSGDWTLKHAFFADAGGFLLRDVNQKTIPLNAEQLFFLVEEGYVDMPKFTQKEIDDKNKADIVLRYYWLAQILWFSIVTAMRSSQGLPTCTLELTTLAFVICSAISSLFRFRKPGDVRVPESVKSKYTIAEIVNHPDSKTERKQASKYTENEPGELLGTQPGERPTKRAPKDGHFRYTELDFVSHREWHFSKLWAHWTEAARTILHLPKEFFGPHHGRIDSTYCFPMEETSCSYFLLLAVSFGYAAIFFVAWDHDFAMPVQLCLWRASIVSVLAGLVGYDIVQRFGFVWWPAIWRAICKLSPWIEPLCLRIELWLGLEDNDGAASMELIDSAAVRSAVMGDGLGNGSDAAGGNNVTPGSQSISGRIRARIRRGAAWFRNNSPRRADGTQDPNLKVPLKIVLPMYFLGAAFIIGRTMILVIDIWELTSLPAASYKTVDWSWSALAH